MANLLRTRRFGTAASSGMERFCQLGGSRPVQPMAKRADSAARPLPSRSNRSAAASAASTVSGRSARGSGSRALRKRRATPRRTATSREADRCNGAPSASDQSAPARFGLVWRCSEQPRADPNSNRPRSSSASACASPQGNGSSSGSQALRAATVRAADPARQQLGATACNRGSAGDACLASSSSSRSRHQASRIAPSRGSLLVDDNVGEAQIDVPQRGECRPQRRAGSCSSAI